MKKSQIIVSNDMDQFEKTRRFISDGLTEMHVPKQMIRENALVFEEIFLRIIDQCQEEKTEITVSLIKTVSDVKILIEFYGERFNMDFQSTKHRDTGTVILGKFEDIIGLNYKNRHNSICITAKRTYDRMSLICCLTMLLAVIIYGAARVFLSVDALMRICDNIIIPLERMFANAITMIAGPITFFSIVTNITDCYVTADHRISLGKLGIKAILSSVLAEAAAVVYYFFLTVLHTEILFPNGEKYNVSESVSSTFFDSLWNLVPENIVQPFMSEAPFQIILIAIITSAAICVMNRHFNTIKELNDTVNDLFNSALSILMLFMPAASFLALFDTLIEYGFTGLLIVFMLVTLLFIGVLLMMLLEMIRIAAHGINPFDFIKKWLPAAVENFKINSGIDAVPYNIRFCNKTFGISINKLEKRMPILAQINQTGNCFILLTTTLFMMSFTKKVLDPVSLILLGILVIFVSMGAPGRPASLLIGLVILFNFTGISLELIATAIYTEAIVGRILPILSTLFDIATVVTEEKSALKTADPV